ncbi:Leucine-rich repeat [Macleaya cordata]|uniref:Leucine-rich repeat n=1 Tax=Macleaya cordata TaxID=56857 RepID=A0A200Q4W3_MACCD|nr:Leucine-rich repeat [Macleaya cordata]
MADTVIQVLVSPFLGLLFDNLKSLIQKEFGLIWGVNEEMEKLSNTLSTIRDVLEDAEVKQIKDKSIQNWLRKLKEAAYDAEDLLDLFATPASTPESETVETQTFNNIQLGKAKNVSRSTRHLSLIFDAEQSSTILESLKGILVRQEGLLVSFPSLEELRFHRMPNLEKWRINSISSPSEEVQVLVFPCLRALTINGCPKLTTCPPFPSSLKYLWLCGCNEMILRSLKYLPPCLYSLRIEEFGELISFPEEGLMMLRNLTALQSLDIKYCLKLKTLPSELLENLTALTNLSIWRCGELISFPEEIQNLTSLKSFDIDRCDSLKTLPEMGISNTLKNLFIQHCGSLTSLSAGLRNLTTLKSLSIKECEELEFFPEDFEHLIALLRLRIGTLPKLASLPVGLQHVTTLEYLEVWDCSSFTTLPEWIRDFRSLHTLEILGCKNLKFLPEGLQQLTALRNLKIKECHPDLHRRCEKEKGDDWYKIAHIPNLMIQTERSGSGSSSS